MGEVARTRLLLPPRHLHLIMALLPAQAPGARVLAFGSRVRGTACETADLDLAVECPDHPDQELPIARRLAAALTESSLPIFVDVLPWSSLPDDFKRQILDEYIVLQ